MSHIYLIPSFLDEEATNSLPAQVRSAVEDCQVFFVENERSARRFLKSIWKDMIIDNYEWHLADKSTISNPATIQAFKHSIKENKNIGIISEAGCPGIADPGQQLVSIAHSMNVPVKPLVGPSSILLALMASGMNGQQFTFNGYLPIDTGHRVKNIREMEIESAKRNCTQIFMETPYRNNQLLETLLKHCKGSTKLCIASNITSPNESIKTLSIDQWKRQIPDLHKKPTIFVLQAEQ